MPSILKILTAIGQEGIPQELILKATGKQMQNGLKMLKVKKLFRGKSNIEKSSQSLYLIDFLTYI